MTLIIDIADLGKNLNKIQSIADKKTYWTYIWNDVREDHELSTKDEAYKWAVDSVRQSCHDSYDIDFVNFCFDEDGEIEIIKIVNEIVELNDDYDNQVSSMNDNNRYVEG